MLRYVDEGSSKVYDITFKPPIEILSDYEDKVMVEICSCVEASNVVTFTWTTEKLDITKGRKVPAREFGTSRLC